MYERGTLIMYGITGVCRVEDIGPMTASRGSDKDRLYYTLSPVYGSGTIYVPVDTKIFMRPILSHDDALSLIRRIPEIQSDYETGGDWHTISALYQECLHSHTCEELVHMIKSIHRKNQDSAHLGKRPYKVDQEFKKRAEALLYGELAAALGIAPEDVPALIKKELEEIE